MLKDLFEHYLQEGMSKAEVTDLLGSPYSDWIQERLPKGMDIPDSVDIVNDSGNVGEVKKERERQLDRFNNWYMNHSVPKRLLGYPVGWDLLRLFKKLGHF